MQAVSAIMNFLLSLMRDEDTKSAFEQDPEGTLARNGLDGITGQDIRDARLIMADNGGVRAKAGEHTSSGHADPVREIHHTTRNYEVNEHHSVSNVDQTFNILKIDDRDTLINDSFNSDDDTDVTAIQDNSRTDVDVLDVDVRRPAGEETGETPEPAEEPESPPEPTEEPVADEPEPEPAEEPVVPEEPEEPVEDEPDLDAAIV